MIDTIRICLHGLERYADIVQDIQMNKGGVSEEWVEGGQQHLRDFIRFRVLRFDGTVRDKVAYYGKLRIASSSYEVNTYVDMTRDCVFFEFSIPKWLYGSNVVQFVQHRTEVEKFFDPMKAFKWSENVNHVHERLL